VATTKASSVALHPLDLLLGLGHALLALGRAADANGLTWTYLP
jgi:hypothetical protein